MSDPTPAPRRILHLVVEGFPAEKLAEIVEASPRSSRRNGNVPLTEANAREALEMIFAADTVAVWGKL